MHILVAGALGYKGPKGKAEKNEESVAEFMQMFGKDGVIK